MKQNINTLQRKCAARGTRFPRRSPLGLGAWAILCIALCALVLTGCETTVAVDVARPAELDIAKDTSVAALPFKTSAEMGNSHNPNAPFGTFGGYFATSSRLEQTEEQEVTATLDKLVNKSLQGSQYLSFVDMSTVEAAWRNRAQLSVIDVYITGGITYYESNIEKEIREDTVTDKATGTKSKVKVPYYRRKGLIELAYQVVDANNDAVLAYQDFSKEFSSSWSKDMEDLGSASSLLRTTLTSVAQSIVYKLEPHEETVSLTLLKHSDDEMKAADKIAKKGQLATAESKFLSIYNRRGIFEAGYNAAILLQAMERYEEARSLMSDVYYDSGDKRAKEAVQAIEAEIRAKQRLNDQVGR